MSWEEVPVEGLIRVQPRTDHVMVTLSEREILILGGQKSGKMGDGYILQTVPAPKRKINMKLFGLESKKPKAAEQQEPEMSLTKALNGASFRFTRVPWAQARCINSAEGEATIIALVSDQTNYNHLVSFTKGQQKVSIVRTLC